MDTIGSPVLQIEGLVKHYGGTHAVRGIDLDIRAGEVFGFLGPNGAGKTTTIRCILDLIRPTSGRIEVFGQDPRRDGLAVRSRIGYVPGELRLPERQTGRQLADAIGRLRGGFDPSHRDELAQRLDLDLDRRLRELSSGNRRKVALLLALVSNADLLILDEPTNGLDPLMQHEFLRLVSEARAAGATIFLSSHVLSEVQRAADRVGLLKDGRIVAIGTVEELRGRARQRIDVWFADDPPTAELDALSVLDDRVFEGRRFTAVLTGPIQPLLETLARNRVASMLIEEPDLDEAFLDLYEDAV